MIKPEKVKNIIFCLLTWNTVVSGLPVQLGDFLVWFVQFFWFCFGFGKQVVFSVFTAVAITETMSLALLISEGGQNKQTENNTTMNSK